MSECNLSLTCAYAPGQPQYSRKATVAPDPMIRTVCMQVNYAVLQAQCKLEEENIVFNCFYIRDFHTATTSPSLVP
jgi:hypothetical protein